MHMNNDIKMAIILILLSQHKQIVAGLNTGKDSYVVVTVVLAETKMPTEWTSNHRNDKNTIQTFSLFYSAYKKSSLLLFFMFYWFSDTENVFEHVLNPIFKSGNKFL